MSRKWGDLAADAVAGELPYVHRRALDITVNHFDGRLVPGDIFMASLNRAALHDLVDLGYMRRRLTGYEATLAGRRALRPAQS